MCTAQQVYYYEVIHGTVYLLDEGAIREFSSREQALAWIDDPFALLIEVTPENYHGLYEAGEFFR
jgi:hypothetical protein